MTLFESIDERLIQLDKIIKKAKAESALLSQGNLTVKREKGFLRYYYSLPNDSKRIYVSKSNTELIKSLERKKYLTILIKAANEEKNILIKMVDELNSINLPEKVFYSLPKEEKTLIEPFDFFISNIDSAHLKAWTEDSKYKKYIDENLNKLITKKGDRVRSKSELIIADKLFDANIQYHYERRILLLDNQIGEVQQWYPDFTILNKRTGKQFYWEHFGLMDKPNYCNDAIFKLEFFAKNNILLGDNLIITMESSSVPLSTEHLDKLITKFLI